MGTQAVQPALPSQQAAAGSNFDSFAAAPYLFSSLNDTSSNEAIFGPMFAQPESIDSVSTGYMYQQAQAAKAAGKNMNVYEVQLSTLSGSASQSMVNAVVPSVSAGITVADHMLLMMRDLGIKTQNIWALPQYEFQFNGGPETTPLWGTVIDMGGPTNLVRPVFLAHQLTNTAILPTLLTSTQTGANPTWNQAYTTNDNFSLSGAHYIQNFAFTDGNKLNIILFNLSRTTALPVNFAGLNTPLGTATISTVSGIVTIGITALGGCHKNSSMTTTTVNMISTIVESRLWVTREISSDRS